MHLLPPILLGVLFGFAGNRVIKYRATKKHDSEHPDAFYHYLRGLNINVLIGSIAFTLIAAVFLLLYIAKIASTVLEAPDWYLTFLVYWWVLIPALLVNIFCQSSIVPFLARLYDRDLPYARMLVRGMLEQIGFLLTIGSVFVLFYVALLSTRLFIISTAIIFVGFVIRSAIYPLLARWTSLRREPLKSTHHTIDDGMIPEINDFNVYVEDSFSDDDDNAIAEGFGIEPPSITLRDNVFTKSTPVMRQATLYHEIAHHEYSDIATKTLLHATSLTIVFIVCLKGGSLLAAMFGLQINPVTVIVAGALPAIVTGHLFGLVIASYSRRCEYRADDYAAENVSAEAMGDAIATEGDNTNRSWYRRLLDTHPTPEERIEHLRSE